MPCQCVNCVIGLPNCYGGPMFGTFKEEQEAQADRDATEEAVRMENWEAEEREAIKDLEEARGEKDSAILNE